MGVLNHALMDALSSALSGRRRKTLEQLIAAMYQAGVQGAWYDPSDLTTLFQDAAGTTPVTAVEQPVGLILDKSRGLVLGPELVTNGRFDLSTEGWVPHNNSSILTQINGELELTSVNGGFCEVRQNISTVVGKSYIIKGQGYYKGGTARTMRTGVINVQSGPLTTSPVIADITPHIFTATTAITSIVVTFIGAVAGEKFGVDNISVRELPGNHAFQATATSRPVLQKDASGRYYLSFDGVDDWMRTNSIDFTSTDKMTVFAGLRKLLDVSAAPQIVCELSAATTSNIGSFNLRAPSGAVNNNDAAFSSRGSGNVGNAQSAVGSYPSPISLVIAVTGNISGDSAVLRVNGSVSASSSEDQGAGNYGNYPLYIGRRGGTSLPLNGRIYSLIIRGAQSTEQQIASAEAWVNTKTGAY